MIKIEKILFPTDFSEQSEHAFGYALSFAKEYGAQLLMLHVVEDVQYLANAYMFDVPMMPSFADLEQNRVKEMDEFVESQNIDPSVKIEKSVRHGRPFVEIIQAAREEKVDLIVIATHGRGGFEHLLFGSTAEKVVRKAPCPVLSIRLPGQEFEMP
jgi:nucleotide-binding universal stress UspA family protein